MDRSHARLPIAVVAPMVEQRTENSCVAGSSPACGTNLCARSSVGLEHNATNVGVGGSNPFGRTNLCAFSINVRASLQGA